MKAKPTATLSENAIEIALMGRVNLVIFDPDGNDFAVINFKNGNCETLYAEQGYKLHYPATMEMWLALYKEYLKKKFTFELS